MPIWAFQKRIIGNPTPEKAAFVSSFADCDELFVINQRFPRNPPSPEKAVDWTISQLAKQITMSAETRKAYKRAFMMSLHDNGKAQGKK